MVLDIAQAQAEPVIQPHGIVDVLRWEEVASLQGFLRSIGAGQREFDSASRRPADLVRHEIAIAYKDEIERVVNSRVRMPRRLQREAFLPPDRLGSGRFRRRVSR